MFDHRFSRRHSNSLQRADALPAIRPMTLAMHVALLALAVTAITPHVAQAADADSSTSQASVKSYQIAPGPLAAVLGRFAAAAGVALSFDPAVTTGAQSTGLQGNYSVAAGFAALLNGSGLEAVHRGNGQYTLRSLPAVDAASRQDAVLPAVTVKAAQEDGSVVGYVARRTSGATKTSTSILEIPQSISVIGRTEMEARGVQDIMDIVGQTPGIAVNTYGPDPRGWEYIYMRGFPGDSGNYRDGLAQSRFEVIYRMTEPYGLERVEVLRGPSSVMYGQGDAGGIINRTSKQPTGERIREVEVQYGSFDRKQVAFDLGDAIGDSGEFSYRLVGVSLDANDQDRYPDGHKINRTRNYLAPSFRWQPNAATSLTVLGEFLKDESGEDAYYALAADLSVTKVKMGDYSYSRFAQKQNSIGYQFEHAFNDEWSFKQNARYTDIAMDRRALWVDELQPDGHTYTRTKRSWKDQLQQVSLDSQLHGKIRSGAIEHNLLFGMDWNRVEGTALRYRGAGPDLDLLNPVYGLPISDPTTLNADFTQVTNQIGFYAQDQIKIADRWVLSLGGRQDHVRSTTDNRRLSTLTRKSDDAFSGRAGLSYLVGNGWAPYVSYAESFLPTAGLDVSGNPLKPSKGKQTEVGVKFQPANSNTLFTAALFNLQKTNVVTTNPGTGESRQIGEQRSRGLELEAKSEVARGLNVVASYTLMDAKVVQSLDPDELGKRPVAIPRQSASIWVDYALAQGWGIGAGANYIGVRQNWEDNRSAEPGVTLFNALLRYETGPWRLSLNANNLFDKQYNTICFRGECYAGRERTVTMTARYKF
ncbi:MAG: TonB-dependent siderophore receptor [Pseudomonadota bacterium]